jgi:hypothetical protein
VSEAAPLAFFTGANASLARDSITIAFLATGNRSKMKRSNLIALAEAGSMALPAWSMCGTFYKAR